MSFLKGTVISDTHPLKYGIKCPGEAGVLAPVGQCFPTMEQLKGYGHLLLLLYLRFPFNFFSSQFSDFVWFVQEASGQDELKMGIKIHLAPGKTQSTMYIPWFCFSPEAGVESCRNRIYDESWLCITCWLMLGTPVQDDFRSISSF